MQTAPHLRRLAALAGATSLWLAGLSACAGEREPNVSVQPAALIGTDLFINELHYDNAGPSRFSTPTARAAWGRPSRG